MIHVIIIIGTDKLQFGNVNLRETPAIVNLALKGVALAMVITFVILSFLKELKTKKAISIFEIELTYLTILQISNLCKFIRSTEKFNECIFR